MAFAFIAMALLLGSSMMMAFVLDPSRKEPEAAVLGHRSVSISNQNLCNNHTTILRAYVVFVSTAIYLYDRDITDCSVQAAVMKSITIVSLQPNICKPLVHEGI